MSAMLERPVPSERHGLLVGACEDAARRLYAAELALHTARETHIDEWVAAAYDKLHAAIEAHSAAETELAEADAAAA